MEKETVKTTIGEMDITDVVFAEDSLEFFIPVIEIEENIKDILEEKIQNAMEEFQTRVLDEIGMKWSDAGVKVVSQQLHIILTENNVEYELCVGFSDWENKMLESDCKFGVDLSEHSAKLKRITCRTIMKKFFA